MATIASEPALWAGMFALASALYVVRSNPSRDLNRYFAGLSGTVALWQFFFLASYISSHVGLFIRLSATAGALCVALHALCLDAIVKPRSSLGTRLTRARTYIGASIFLATAPWLSGWITVYHQALQPGPLLLLYYVGVGLCYGTLVMKSHFLSAAAKHAANFELRHFSALSVVGYSLVLLSCALGIEDRNAAWLASFALCCYYAVAAWLMTTRRVFDIRDLRRYGPGMLARVSVRAVLLTLVLWVSDPWSPAIQAILTLVIAFPLAHVFDRWFTQRFEIGKSTESRIRQNALRLIADAYADKNITAGFSSLAREYLDGADVEIIVLTPEHPASTLNSNLQTLLAAALKYDFVSPEITQRKSRPNKSEELLTAFRAEKIAGIVAHRSQLFQLIQVVRYRGRSGIITWAEAGFLAELGALCANGLDRIRLAEKAFHSDRLATLGFLTSQVTHEARNALEFVRAAAEMLRDGKEADITPEHRELVLNELTAFIHDFNVSLDMARPDVGTFRLVSLSGVLQDAVQMFLPMARRHHIEVVLEETHGNDSVMIDPRLMRQVVLNLLRNAFEAVRGQPNPRIVVTCWRSGGNMLVNVADNGPGVPIEIYDQLFTKFASTKSGGAGLGLGICRDAMHLLNGTIFYVTPRGAPYAKFQVTLPCADCDEPLSARLLPSANCDYVFLPPPGVMQPANAE